MSNIPRPVRLVAMQEIPSVPTPEAAPVEPLAPELAVEPEASGSMLGKLAGYVGDLATTAVLNTQWKMGEAVEAVSTAISNTKNHLKREGGKIAVRAALSGLVIAGGVTL